MVGLTFVFGVVESPFPQPNPSSSPSPTSNPLNYSGLNKLENDPHHLPEHPDPLISALVVQSSSGASTKKAIKNELRTLFFNVLSRTYFLSRLTAPPPPYLPDKALSHQ